MSTYRLASRYAKSLLDLAIEKDSLEAVFNDIAYFNDVVKKVSEFKAILRSPEINSDKKQHIFNLLFGNFNKITSSFLTIALKKGRESYLPEFASTFVELYHVKNRITPVKLTTAVEADNNIINKVKELLKNKAGLVNIEMETKINPALIGGFILQYDDKMIDASILRKFEQVDDHFLENEYKRKI